MAHRPHFLDEQDAWQDGPGHKAALRYYTSLEKGVVGSAQPENPSSSSSYSSIPQATRGVRPQAQGQTGRTQSRSTPVRKQTPEQLTLFPVN